jgi:hypothetical protein
MCDAGPDYNISKENLPHLKAIFTDLMFLQPIHQQTKLLRDSMKEQPIYYFNYR